RVQRGLPQLGCIHLTQTLVALDTVILVDLATSIKPLFQQLITLSIRVGKPWLTLAPLELVQRWISQEYMAFLNQLRHEAEEQSQQQGSNVLTIDVGVGHEHNLVVAQLGDIKLFVDTRAKRSDDCLDFGVLQHLVHASLLRVQALAAQREHTLEHRGTATLCRTTSGVTLHDVKLRNLRILGTAISELTWQTTQVRRRLTAHQLTRLARCHTSLRRRPGLIYDGLGLSRVGIKPVIEVLINCTLNKALDLRVAQLRLGLTLKLRISNLERDHRCQALTAVITC